jgi:thiol-disulfide isomerase/thioredoxin
MSPSRLSPGCLLVFLVLGACLVVEPAASKPAIPECGDPLPEIVLPLPTDMGQLGYLGLKALPAQTFPLRDVAADLVVVEIFSMYCPHCQREAPKVNALFAALQKRPASAPRIRLLGIGVGNSPMEVDVFRKRYKIAFPLFSDGDFTIHKKLGEVRTPFFFAFRPSRSAPLKLHLTHLGPFKTVDSFLTRLDKLAREQTP